MKDAEIVRFLRSKLRRKEIRVIAKRSNKDRRVAFFNYIPDNDRRSGYERRISNG